ncbi:uncharacterized protein LOC135388172 isoform X2 [Ornithodoros turicata]|uniref:uncharacterized protein LOC135388172 isoform X2 n=1 Tax=Ornithodoros turicata TaxID=34597 RepID=UPI003139032C
MAFAMANKGPYLENYKETEEPSSGSGRRYLSWEAMLVILCGIVLSLVFAFFIHSAIHTKSRPSLGALDGSQSIDNELGDWPSNEYERMHAKKEHFDDATFEVAQPPKMKPKETKDHRAQQKPHKQQHGYMVTFPKRPTRESPKADTSSAAPERPFEDREPPVGSLAPKRVLNHLVCVLSSNVTASSQLPREQCTHLVYNDITYEKHAKRFAPTINSSGFVAFMKLREQAATLKLVVGLNGQFFRNLSDTVEKNAAGVQALAQEMVTWLTLNELSGIALTGQLIMSSRHHLIVKTLRIFHEALQAVGEPKPILLYGGYVATLQYPEKMIMGRLKEIGSVTDLLVIESHYHEEEQFCKIVYPSVYVKIGDYPASIPIKTAMIWMEMLKEDRPSKNSTNMCFSLSMATLSFDVTLDDHTVPGTWCQGRKWINYGSMCTSKTWVVPEEDTTVLSTFRRKKHNWVSYDSDYAIREKVGRAMDVFHGVCVAVYHVDHDDNEGLCTEQTIFPRLSSIREVQKNHVDREYFGIEKKPVPLSHDRERSKEVPPNNTLICVVSEFPTDLDHYPTEFCTHVVYRDVVFFSEHRWFLPKEHEHGFHAFMQLASRTHAQLFIGLDSQQLPDFYIPVWRDPSKQGHFSRSAVHWLNAHGLDGIALLDQHVSSSSVVKKYFPLVKRLRQEFERSERKLSIMVGMSLKDYASTPEDIAEALEDITSVSDYLIIETHYMKPSTPCRVTLPSTYLEHDVLSTTTPVRTAVSWMKLLSVENQTSATLCVSLSMAAINFRIRSPSDNVTCKLEKWVNFRETCSTGENYEPTAKFADAITAYRKNKNTLQAFENEETIREKVERVVSLFPKACVAAFHVEYEDSLGQCHSKFSRLATIEATLKRGPNPNLRDLKPRRKDLGPGGIDTRGRIGKPDDESPTSTTRNPATRPHNLICVMSDNTTEKSQFPDKLCDFIVYNDLTYDGQLDKLIPKNNGSGLQIFSSIAEHQAGNHLVAVSQEDISGCLEKWKDALALSHFVITTTAWVRKNKFDGLAFLNQRVPPSDMPTILKMLHKFHEAFKESRPRSLLLMFGAQISNPHNASFVKEYLHNLEQIAKVADYTIVETHHQASQPCRTHLPNAFRAYNEKADNVPVVTALDWIKNLQQSVSPTPAVCYSLSLASLLYTTSNAEGSEVGVPCVHETLTRYNQTCRRNDWSHPVKVESALSSYQHKGDQWESFQPEEAVTKMLRLAVKINPTACVAAYMVDYEDNAGICERGKTFPRLGAMRSVLDQLRTL